MATGAVPISIDATVDIGFGRGRLAPGPAASLRRIDAQLGRPADINDAWRSPEQADRNRAAWVAYQNGTGPVAPYALDRWGSIHCRGYAGDSDDWYDPEAAAVWQRNGWRQTALYPVGDRRREEWHGEYDEDLDEFLGQTAAGGAAEFNPTDEVEEEDEMKNAGFFWFNDEWTMTVLICNTESGFKTTWSCPRTAEWTGYNKAVREAFGAPEYAPITLSHAEALLASLDRVNDLDVKLITPVLTA